MAAYLQGGDYIPEAFTPEDFVYEVFATAHGDYYGSEFVGTKTDALYHYDRLHANRPEGAALSYGIIAIHKEHVPGHLKAKLSALYGALGTEVFDHAMGAAL